MGTEDVIIIGGGPTGLACAAALQQVGIAPLVLEKGAGVAASWRSRPDGLTLIAGRRASSMPGARFRRGVGLFPTRDELIEHLEHYAAEHSIRVRTGVPVDRVERDGDDWVLKTADEPLAARHVVVATGLFAKPMVPRWPGCESLGPELIHAAQYRNPQPFIGKKVLVVGAGTTGVELASELQAHGAQRVLLSVRTPPNLIPRVLGILPGLKYILRMPDRRGDALMHVMRRALIGDLTQYGLPEPADGPFVTMTQRHATPTNISRACVRAIRAGRIRVVAAVKRVSEHEVELTDGSRVQVDVVIAATGYRPGLEPLVGHLQVLDDRREPQRYLPKGPTVGLHFAGFENVPGQLAFCSIAARRIVTEITADPRLRKPVAR